jgi:hypothetical protein
MEYGVLKRDLIGEGYDDLKSPYLFAQLRIRRIA